jgi:hypothetical protein
VRKDIPVQVRAVQTNAINVFRAVLVALLIGQMAVYYDTATRAAPHINRYLLANLVLIVLAFIPWRPILTVVWLALWPAGAALRWDWATRFTNSDVYWATSQGVDFLLHGLNPYTHVPTSVYEHHAAVGTYPTYSYFPASLLAEVPFALMGNVRIGLALADFGVGVLLFLFARRAGEWPARTLAAFWLIFLPGFQVPLRLGILDSLLLFWIVLAVWCYARGNLVAAAAAAAIAGATKQYGILFVLPWALLLARPLWAALRANWRGGLRGRRVFAVGRSAWLPPAVLVGGIAAIIAPFALISPRAFFDATVVHHARYAPSPTLGTPQWNESIAAQIVALGWLERDTAKAAALIVLSVALVIVLAFAVATVRTLAAALHWSALLAAVWFGLSGMEVQFFYWRLPLVLGLLALVAGWQRPPSESLPGGGAAREVPNAEPLAVH